MSPVVPGTLLPFIATCAILSLLNFGVIPLGGGVGRSVSGVLFAAIAVAYIVVAIVHFRRYARAQSISYGSGKAQEK